MALTFGVLGTIIKACSFHATNQTVVSRLVSTIDPNEKYLDKKNAPAACRLLNCTYDFPDPSVDSESATDLLSLLPNYRDPSKILPTFTEKVLPLMQPDKVRYAIAALQDAVRDDPLTHHEDGEIPTRSFEFFERVYDILSNSHDNTKGGFKRVFATGLDRQTLKQYLAEFAYRAYVAKAWSLSMERCNEIYGSLHSREQEATPTLCADFMTDVTKNLSIMYGEANTFNFYQHTFQEFFTALYFANRPGSQMKNLIRFFESSRPRTLNDYVFPMLYDMRKSQVDESIILPTLRKAFKKRPEAEAYARS